MNKRKIIAITGIRSEYDLMSSVFKCIENDNNLDLGLIVSGAHLSKNYGYTIEEIKEDGFKIVDKIENLINSDFDSSRVKGLGILISGLVQSVVREKPDILLVLGDREESIATALVGAYMNIPTAHVAGGDRVVGNVDDQVRHAVTKLAHIHFTTNIKSYNRILKLGEEEFRVFNVGNPGLDRLLKVPELSMAELSKKLDFKIEKDEPYILVIQHPLSTEIDQAYFQMKQTLKAIIKTALKTIIIYPNSDPGGQEIIHCINEYKNESNIYIAKNLPRLEFVNIMRNARCLLGNSSAGILETPLLGLPVINVGNRQKERLHAQNVEFVNHDVNEICTALQKALFNDDYRKKVKNCQNPYGDGHASEKITHVLSDIKLNRKLLIKDITY